MTHIVTADNPSCAHGYTVTLGPDSIVIECHGCGAVSGNLHFLAAGVPVVAPAGKG